MTIKEAQIKKHNTEAEIQLIITRFEKDTKLVVGNIKLYRVDAYGNLSETSPLEYINFDCKI